MLVKVQLFILHTFVHVFLYVIPRWVHTLLVKVPVTVWEWLTGHRPYTYSRSKERHIKVIASQKDTATSDRLLRLLGLTYDMIYSGPLYNGDIHTIIGNLWRSSRVHYLRELVDGFDGNPICLDWLAVPQGVAARGVILVIPGVGNYSQTPYVQRLARDATSRGFQLCVLSPRGMGSAPLTKPRVTCITFTQDARTVLRERFGRDQIRARFGKDLPVFLLGFSAGGTTVVKAIVEEFDEFKKDPSRYPGGFPVKGMVSMNAPYNMFVHHEILDRCAFYYQQPMVVAMQKYALKHADLMIQGLPGLPSFKDREELEEKMAKLKTANDFVEHIIAPHFGYEEGPAEYYKDAAGFKWLQKSDPSLPVVCVASRHDPITGISHTDEEWQALTDQHPNVVFVETPVGGHLAYLPNPIDVWKEKGSFLTDFPLHVLMHVAEKTSKPKTA
ncbi:hypothetical protein ABB37_00199 [Leptomonas pyrrhocoris]|uniref:AB hydrolase-1 domain-containing protein n=1 Tax=Leptomonas pyrrhocoris TaxID=157538 RepID=A0A0M9GA14_LEPPY|nr:hypothetical protein ABB37_00199 [Leptomonas pyrrhocoris]XP_015664317.1 hypothetical protein ABB37_00199 [Leptomonas pyrrhocoris]KPA85877.1 hypothetical protein ABB37_00199 [Leptomonas pyrrhocoris]KPA85878.1 hypothetical protein ABB37_00199 [Leptomonas pyrrhocoris]|eukprot:XP_015664316.1 hypothetical protein ABB37_00199 [Leptomonas pyrrhocoris]